MIDIGFRAHDLGHFSSAEELAICASSFLPGSCIQLAPNKVFPDAPPMLTEKYASSVAASLEKHNIRTAVLGCYINPVHPDPDQREADLNKFETYLKLVHLFPGAVVGTETGNQDPIHNTFHPETGSRENYELFLRSIDRLLSCAIKNNAVMAIEAVAWKDTIDTASKMRSVMDHFSCSNLRVIFDPVNIFPKEGSDNPNQFFTEALDLLSPFICAMHLKDYIMLDDKTKKGNLTAGTGLMDYPAFASLTKAHDINVPMLLENLNPSFLEKTIALVKSAFQD